MEWIETVLQWISEHLLMLYLFGFATFLGVEVVRGVSSVLHTPLMSLANALSGLVVIGAIVLIKETPSDNYLQLFIGFIGLILGTINVVGGFAVTQRMLEMFKRK